MARRRAGSLRCRTALQRRRVGEQQLQDHDRADAERQVLVAEMRLERQRRVQQVAAVQQIEDLADRDRVDRDRPGELRPTRPATSSRRTPTECKREQRQADEDDAPDPEAGQDRTVDRARRPLHDVELVRLEGDHEPERDGGHHVDPEDLRRGDRHGEADEDRHQ